MPEPLPADIQAAAGSRIGVDVGGTFTDFVQVDGDRLRVLKRLSSPRDPGQSVLEGVRSLDPGAAAPIVHGTTVATNALLEGRGARTALVTTRGFEDLLAIGRGHRADLYRLEPLPRPRLIAEDSGLIFGIEERIGADGEVIHPLSEPELRRLVAAIDAARVDAVAVCLLFAYLRPEHERRVAAGIEALGARAPRVSISSEVLPEIREYERASTVVANAYVRPIVAGYLESLERDLAPRELSVMGSHGGLMSPRTASRLPAQTVLSGPAAGVAGALEVARRAGMPRVISFDMGGTSTDVALCDDALPYTSWSEVAGIPVHLPSLDVHTVGAGGGSVVWVDAAGGLRVGPRSAGADPGPACYGRGGHEATLSDANLLLGRLPATRPLAGGLALDLDAAGRAFAPLATALGCRVEEAAFAAVAVGNAHMERALRHVSVRRGKDPVEFGLLTFGGAGGLHACELAEGLGIRRILLPVAAGALSALGLALASPMAQASRGLPLRALRDTERERAVFEDLIDETRRQLRGLVDSEDTLRVERLMDMRYKGQSWELTVPWHPGDEAVRGFEAMHRQRYGFAREGAEVELTTLRVRSTCERPRHASLHRVEDAPAEPTTTCRVHVEASRPAVEVPLVARAGIQRVDRLEGPAVITQSDATTYLAPGWSASRLETGDLLLARDPS